MKKFSGKIKISTAVFISGKGTNLKNLIKFSNNKDSPIKINLVVSNKLKAKGLKYADQFKIKKQIFNFKDYRKTENKISVLLKKEKIKFICLAGFMKILSKKFINKFDGKIINIHPSLLPKYKGLYTHRRAIKNNAFKINNVTLTDENKIIQLDDFNNEKSLKISFGKKKHYLIKII